MKRTADSRAGRPNLTTRAGISLATLICALATATGTGVADPAATGCAQPHWVGSWAMGPSDASPVSDMSLTPITSLFDQTYRIVVTPHLGGRTVRVHLTNKQSPLPVTFGAVTIAEQAQGAAIRPGTLRTVTFGGSRSVTAAPGADVISDPIQLSVNGFEPLAISIYVPGQSAAATENIISLSTSYYGPPGSGDRTSDQGGSALSMHTTAALWAGEVDVLAPPRYSSLVAMGDSIGTGYEGATYYEGPQDPAIVDRNLRYTDFLQHRLDAAGTPVAVLNSSIWGNRVLSGETAPQTGPSALSRLRHDAVDVAGIRDVIFEMGTNDLAFPPTATPDQLIAGYIDVINQLHAAGIRVHLTTIPPSVHSWIAGGLAPGSDPLRQQVNQWIRTQHLSDSAIDFDAVLRDPADPSADRPDIVSPTLVHPNPKGHKMMADAIDIGRFQGSQCR